MLRMLAVMGSRKRRRRTPPSPPRQRPAPPEPPRVFDEVEYDLPPPLPRVEIIETGPAYSVDDLPPPPPALPPRLQRVQ